MPPLAVSLRPLAARLLRRVKVQAAAPAAVCDVAKWKSTKVQSLYLLTFALLHPCSSVFILVPLARSTAAASRCHHEGREGHEAMHHSK